MRGRLTQQALGIRVFSSASDATRSRRPTDAILLVLAIVGALVLSLYAPGPTAIDTAATDLVAQFPDLAGWFWEVTYDLLIVWSLGAARRDPVRARTEAIVPVRGGRRGARDWLRDPRRRRRRHARVHEPVGHHQLRVAADLPGDACRDRDRGDRDRIAGPVEAVAAGRPMADRHRRRSRGRAGCRAADRGRGRVPDRARLRRVSASPLRLTRRSADPRAGDGGTRGTGRRSHGHRGRPAAGSRRGAHDRNDARREAAPGQDLRPGCRGRPTRGRHLVRDLAPGCQARPDRDDGSRSSTRRS